MFARFFFVAALVSAVAIAAPGYEIPCDDPIPAVHGPVKTCNRGNLRCCNSVQDAKSINFKTLLGDQYSLLPDTLEGTNVPIGLDCSPLILGAGGGCNQQTVCCDGGHMSGLLSINCNAYQGGMAGLLNVL
ncbi:hypothetical protein K488DRAFT_72576 [Vararia minispora EC-137]|uniref:Uncharacterized protein n=1 Tax=Vararia minispora EC-137 TaxID=1314806 RepID=A0ACB8QDQ1_9AGAM|nr:hypothetical protein K488DRAFT_72576 [Vararia minispora EC-137]